MKKSLVPGWYANQCWKDFVAYLGPWDCEADRPENYLADCAASHDVVPFDPADLDLSKSRMAGLLGINRGTVYTHLMRGEPPLRLTKDGKITLASALKWLTEYTKPLAVGRAGERWYEDRQQMDAEIRYCDYLENVLLQSKYKPQTRKAA